MNGRWASELVAPWLDSFEFLDEGYPNVMEIEERGGVVKFGEVDIHATVTFLDHLDECSEESSR